MTNTVGFPGLGIGPFEISRVAFTLFDKDIYWYGVIIALGFMAGILIGLKFAPKCNLTRDDIFDIVLVGGPSAIIGARLYYVLFNLEDYSTIAEAFEIWNGGLAIYGGVIGGALAVAVLCKVKKLKLMDVYDIGVMGIVTGQIIGRWGNFMNAEAYGYETTSIFRMFIQGVGEVHPTFLYECVWNIALLSVLIYFVGKKKFSGQIFYTYIAGYGLGRFMIEGLRTDSLYAGDFRVSQIVALLCVVVGGVALVLNFIKLRKKEE